MNKVILMGRLTRDPNIRYSPRNNSQEEMAIARYTLAVDRRGAKDGQQSADFISCVAFGRDGEFAEKYLKQGTKVVVTGRIQTGSYTNRDGQKVYATDVIVEEVDDIFANAPNVKVIRQSFKLPEQIRLPIEMEDKFSEWLGKAEIAYRERLGAGAVIYLRSIFEKVTHEVGLNAGVEIYKNNGKAKPFEQVLKAVDAQCSIIPAIYSQNGYDLFSKLSEIAHGNSDEATALKEYESLRRLVVGIIENVKRKNEELKNNTEIQRALNEIGFNNGGEEDV